MGPIVTGRLEVRPHRVDRAGVNLTEQPAGHRPSVAASIGGPSERLSPERVRRFVGEQLARADLDGRSVCVIVPDGTRSCPLPLLLGAVHRALTGRVSRLTVLVALGTHAALSADQLAHRLGYDVNAPDATYPGISVLNHEWWDPASFVDLGSIPAARIRELSAGRLDRSVDVRLNRAVVEHDVALVVGPVFPHEVVGFSGGNKYFFPGVGGQDVIDVSHWLGALITSRDIIGTRGTTPVRALIDEAAAMVPAERLALSVVVAGGGEELHAVAFGDPVSSWAAAADVAAETHVRYLDQPVRRVLSVIPEKYDDMWTAAKGFYKVEPIVSDGGEVVIYAPHITQISRMHPEINEIGYHCRDYFLAQWARFSGYHWGVLAHSTHLAGVGTYDPVGGEHLRVQVTLATGIPRDVVEAANLGYLDPADVDAAGFDGPTDCLVVPDAGEVLYRLAEPQASVGPGPVGAAEVSLGCGIPGRRS
jgi:nickel-dependent lactate racemase